MQNPDPFEKGGDFEACRDAIVPYCNSIVSNFETICTVETPSSDRRCYSHCSQFQRLLVFQNGRMRTRDRPFEMANCARSTEASREPRSSGRRRKGIYPAYTGREIAQEDTSKVVVIKPSEGGRLTVHHHHQAGEKRPKDPK